MFTGFYTISINLGHSHNLKISNLGISKIMKTKKRSVCYTKLMPLVVCWVESLTFNVLVCIKMQYLLGPLLF